MSAKTISAVELAAAHEATLQDWEKQLAALNAEIEELVDYEISVRMEFQSEHPSSRSDTLDSPVTKLRKKIDDLVGKRHRLAKDIEAKKQILEGLREQADSELAEQRVRENQAAIDAAELNLSEKWAVFVAAAEDARKLWRLVAEAATDLDALPAGSAPISPFPSSLAEAFRRALAEPGNEPFASDPRIVAKRIPTAGTSAATDTRGFATTLRELGDY